MIPTLLAGAALAGPPLAGTCQTPAAIDALAGRGLAPHAYAVQPPPRLDGRPLASPPGGGKQVYGTPYEQHLETENFTINWWQDGVTQAMAESAAAALETAWDSYTAAGWTPPVSSDRYYLWVLLDRDLGATTGYTTEYFTPDYPDGYPIIWLNPDTAWDGPFWASLAAHELMHAFQYAVRDYDGGGEIETWYWEASATWASELADPGVDGHQYTSDWYAGTADLTYSSTVDARQYGLFVWNAWLDGEGLGAGTMREIWALSADRPGQPWDTITAEATGQEMGQLWAGFTGAYVNEGLAESALYGDIPSQGALGDDVGGELPYLGSHSWRAEADVAVTAEGSVLLGGVDGVGASLRVPAGQRVSVTGVDPAGASYTLRVEAWAGGDTGDTGAGGSDGGGDGGGAPSARDRGGCGCAGAAGAGYGWLLPLYLVTRRRKG